MDYATPNPDSLGTPEAKPITPINPITQAATDLRDAAADKAKEAAQEVQNKAAQLKTAATEKAQQYRSIVGEKATALKEGASSKATYVKDVTSEKFNQSCDKAKDLHTSAEEYVRANPTKSVLGALGIGIVIGLISRR